MRSSISKSREEAEALRSSSDDEEEDMWVVSVEELERENIVKGERRAIKSDDMMMEMLVPKE